MALYDDPPHAVDVYTSASSTDSGGGVRVSYSASPSRSAVPCSINTASASEAERYAQQNIVVSHTVAFLGSAVTLLRGYKLVATDTGEAYHVHGIRKGRGYGGVPALLYADAEQIL